MSLHCIQEYVFYEDFTDLLMMKLSPPVRRRAIKRIANFMVTSAVPCVVQECGQLCSSISKVDPEASVQYLVNPLLEKILPELPPVQGIIKCCKLQSVQLNLLIGKLAFQFFTSISFCFAL